MAYQSLSRYDDAPKMPWTEVSESTTSQNQVVPLGRPTTKDRLETLDLLALSVVLSCWILTIVTIAEKNVARTLGQKNQLVVLGLLLALMGFAAQRQALLLLLTIESRSSSILQHYDGILRNNVLADNIAYALRLQLLFLFILPLGLSAAYKQFVGGQTDISLSSQSLLFGTVAPPGLYLGNGLGPMVNATLPLYRTTMPLTEQNPAQPGPYGFNMYMVSENMTAMLDAPTNKQLSDLQKTLHGRQTLKLSATVNATIARLNSTADSPARREFKNHTTGYYRSTSGLGQDIRFAMGTRSPDYSLLYLGHWNSSNETFEGTAVGVNLLRGWCSGTWLVTLDTVRLVNASDCHLGWDPSKEPPPKDRNQGMFTRSSIMLEDIYKSTMAELITVGIPGNSPTIPTWIANVAAMGWARIVALWGPTQLESGPTLEYGNDSMAAFRASAWYEYDLYYTRSTTMVSTTPTLQCDWKLFAVMAIQPVVMIVSLCVRLLLYSSPISSGFGLVALLAGVNQESLVHLRGAGFSGLLSRPVRVSIHTDVLPETTISEESSAFDRGRVRYTINSPLPNSELRSKVMLE